MPATHPADPARIVISPAIRRGAGRRARLAIFLAWAALTLFLASRHVLWRDEVRARTLALSGGDVIAMLRAVHGEGHPAIWYLALRGLHVLAPSMPVLTGLAFVVGTAAAALFVARAPFGWPLLALALAGRPLLYEYVVMARNYGIAVLAMVGFAALYRRHRDRGWVLGSVLALLANTNVPAVGLAGALWLFWAIDIAAARDAGSERWRAPAIGGVMLAIGIGVCFATVYPPFNDAAVTIPPAGPLPLALLRMIAASGDYFDTLIPAFVRKPTHLVLVPLLLGGSLVALSRSPAALIAAAAGLGALLILFAFVYAGFYRHQAMGIPLLLTLAWLQAEGAGGRWPARFDAWLTWWWLRWIGTGAFALLLSLQVVQGVTMVVRAGRGMPESRSAELTALLRRPELARAIVIGDPDYNLEPLAGAVPNPIWFARERRFGRYVVFSQAAKRTMTPVDVLDAGIALRGRWHRPVVIVMSEGIFRDRTPGGHQRGGYGATRQSAADLARFAAETRPLASFGPLDEGDETYDVFLLATPAP